MIVRTSKRCGLYLKWTKRLKTDIFSRSQKLCTQIRSLREKTLLLRPQIKVKITIFKVVYFGTFSKRSGSDQIEFDHTDPNFLESASKRLWTLYAGECAYFMSVNAPLYIFILNFSWGISKYIFHSLFGFEHMSPNILNWAFQQHWSTYVIGFAYLDHLI
jgi:hypothetical protein